jgi:error-prone DNA polymerase
MGFYSSATLIKDAQRRGLRFLPVSVCESQWNCTVIDDQTVRLGLCVVHGLRHENGAHLLLERMKAPFASVADFNMRTKLSKAEQRTLAKIGALKDLSAHRRDALWQVEFPFDAEGLFTPEASAPVVAAPLAPMNAWERLSADMSGMSLSIGKHPMRLLRPQVPQAWRAADLRHAAHGIYLQVAGQVICRQRPGTAKGFVFISLEDETGVANAIVVPQLFERHRLLITSESFLIIEGQLQNLENVIHIKARHIAPLPGQDLHLAESHDFR